jgi:hypothetical protein
MIVINRIKNADGGYKSERIIPTNDLIGKNYALKWETEFKVVYYVSPAIFELLQDEEVKHIVMKQIQVVDYFAQLDDIVADEFQQLLNKKKGKKK